MLNGQIISDKELSGKLVKNEELFNHEYLYNRNAYDAHPIHAITGLKEKLAELENKTPNDFKLIKAEISRLLTNISDEGARAQASEKQIQADIDKLTKALATIQNNEETEKLIVAIAKLRVENLELKNELSEAVNKVSEGLVEQINLIQDFSTSINASITSLTEADIAIEKEFNEKFSSTEALVSANTNAIAELTQRVTNQEVTLNELKTELETLKSNLENPDDNFLDSLLKTFVTTEDLAAIEQDIADLRDKVNDLELFIKGNDGILSRVNVLEAQADTIQTLAADIQTLSENIINSNNRITLNEENIEANRERLQSIQQNTESNAENISTVTSEIESLKTAVELIEENVTENSRDITEIDNIKASLSDLNDDIIRVRADLDDKIQKEVDLLNGSLSKATEYINVLEEAKTTMQEDILSLQIDVDNIKTSTEELSQIVEPLSDAVAKLEKEENRKYHEACTYIDKQLDEITKKLTAALDTNTDHRNAINTINSNIQRLTTSSEASIAELTTITDELSTDINSLRSTIGTPDTPYTLSTQIKTNKEAIEKNNEIIKGLSEAAVALNQVLDTLKEKISAESEINTIQKNKLNALDKDLSKLRIDVFGTDDSLDADVKDLQNQINNMSSVFHLVGIVDTTTTEVYPNGKPKHLVSKPNSGNAKITLKNSIYNNVNNAYEAKPGDVVLVEIFNNNNESLGYVEFIFINQDWEELGNVHNLENQLRHVIQVAINEQNAHITSMDTKVSTLEEDISHHIANDFETRSLIFSSKESAELYARGMDPERFPPPNSDSVEDLLANRTNAYPGLIITVVTDGLYESYIIKEDRSLALISGGGGSGSPDKITDTQYCVQELSGRTLNITNATLDTFKNALSDSNEIDETTEVIKITIDKPERKNNIITTYRTLSPGGYVYYISKLDNLKFTSSGFDAGFTRLDGISLDGYYVYRTNQKLIEPVEITIN